MDEEIFFNEKERAKKIKKNIFSSFLNEFFLSGKISRAPDKIQTIPISI